MNGEYLNLQNMTMGLFAFLVIKEILKSKTNGKGIGKLSEIVLYLKTISKSQDKFCDLIQAHITANATDHIELKGKLDRLKNNVRGGRDDRHRPNKRSV